MTVITLKNYGPGPEIHVVVDHIGIFWEISYNGVVGTEIALTNGKTIKVGVSAYELASALQKL